MMVFVSRQQGLKLQGCFRQSTTEDVTIEQSPMNAGNIRVTVHERNGEHRIFELTKEGKRVDG